MSKPRVVEFAAVDWPEDARHENGQYQCRCVHCLAMFIGHKRRVVCKLCDKAPRRPSEVLVDDFRSRDA